MAIFKYFPNFDEESLDEDILLQQPERVSTTQVVQELGGDRLTFSGTFDLGGPRYITDGTITGLTVSQNGNVGIAVTGLDVDANAYLDAVENEDFRALSDLINGASDKVLGSYQAEYLSSGRGNDTIKGYKGEDYLEGESGNDKLYGGSGRDYLNGGTGNDYLNGGTGNDYLEGKSGKDVLIGGGGRDYLLGGGGADKLNGGKGDDALIGGKGADVFVFRSGGGSDVIFDFKDGIDRIDIDQSFKSLEIVDRDHGVSITGDGWDVFVNDISASDLSRIDFI